MTMNDILRCINEQRREIHKNRDVGSLSEEDELSLLSQRMLMLENYYDDFQKLSVVQELRSFLAHKIFDGNDKKKDKDQQTNATNPASHSSPAHSCLDKARREVIQDLKNRIVDISDSMLLISSTNDDEFKSSSPKKQKKGNSNFELFDFDDLPPYEPLENILKGLRGNCLQEEGILKLLDMDAMELIEHPQWEELVALLNKGLMTIREAPPPPSSSMTDDNGNSLAIQLINVHVKFYCAFSGQQSIDIAMNIIRYLWAEWNLSLGLSCESSPSHPPHETDSSIHTSTLPTLQRIQLSVFTMILTSAPQHFNLISDKTVDSTVGCLFMLLSHGSVCCLQCSDASSVSVSQRIRVLDLIAITADKGRFLTRYGVAGGSLQVTALALQTGLMDGLERRIGSLGSHEGVGKLTSHLPLSPLIFLRMWLVLLGPIAKKYDGAAGDSAPKPQAMDMPQFELVASTNKKFTKVAGTTSVIELLMERPSSAPKSPYEGLGGKLLGAFRVFLHLTSHSHSYSHISDLVGDVFNLFIAIFQSVMTREGEGEGVFGMLEEFIATLHPHTLQSSDSIQAVLRALEGFICLEGEVTSALLSCFCSTSDAVVTCVLHLGSSSSNSGNSGRSGGGVALTLDIIRSWVRVVSALPPPLSSSVALVTGPLLQVIKLCVWWLRAPDASTSASTSTTDAEGDGITCLRHRVRSSALELLITVTNHTIWTHLHGGEGEDLLKEVADILLLSMSKEDMLSLPHDFSAMDCGKAAAVLNIHSHLEEGTPYFFSPTGLSMLEKDLVSLVTDPYMWEGSSSVLEGPISSLFCLLDGMALLGHLETILLLLIQAKFPLHRFLSTPLSSWEDLSPTTVARQLYVAILTTDPEDFYSEDFGKFLLGLLDLSMMSINFCLRGTTPPFSQFVSAASLDKLCALDVARGRHPNPTTDVDVGPPTTDFAAWSEVDVHTLVAWSYSALSSDIWSETKTIPMIDINLLQAHDPLAYRASEVLYDERCKCVHAASGDASLSEAFNAWDKTEFQQLVISCSNWFPSPSSSSCSPSSGQCQEEKRNFNWFVGACSLSWSRHPQLGTSSLPFILQHVCGSPKWTDFFSKSVTQVCDLLLWKGSSDINLSHYFSNIGFPVTTVIKAIVDQWFFKYLSTQDIRRLTVMSVLQGPHIVTSIIAAIMHHFASFARESNLKERGMIAFHSMLSRGDLTLLKLSKQIQTYLRHTTR